MVRRLESGSMIHLSIRPSTFVQPWANIMVHRPNPSWFEDGLIKNILDTAPLSDTDHSLSSMMGCRSILGPIVQDHLQIARQND